MSYFDGIDYGKDQIGANDSYYELNRTRFSLNPNDGIGDDFISNGSSNKGDSLFIMLTAYTVPHNSVVSLLI